MICSFHSRGEMGIGNALPALVGHWMRILLTFGILLLALPLSAEDTTDIGIVDRPGEYIDLSTTFTDEFGNQVELARLFKQPTILSFVYYRCPGICSPLLDGLQHAVDKLQLDPGEDFRVITVSISDTEDHQLAASKKRNYLQGLERTFPEAEWRWLTGDSTNIAPPFTIGGLRLSQGRR